MWVKFWMFRLLIIGFISIGCHQTSVIAQAIYEARPEGLYIHTPQYELYRIDRDGKATLLHPAPADFAATIPVVSDAMDIMKGGYLATDGRLVLYPNAITREDPYYIVPKEGYTLLQIIPKFNGNAFVIWAEGNDVIVEHYGSTLPQQRYTMPGRPVAAYGRDREKYVSVKGEGGIVSNYSLMFENSYLEPKLKGTIVGGNMGGQTMSVVAMVTKGGLTELVYSRSNAGNSSRKPPLPGIYRCLAVGPMLFVIANERGECWAGSHNLDRQLVWNKIALPAGVFAAGAAFVNTPSDGSTTNTITFFTQKNTLLWPKDDYAGYDVSFVQVPVKTQIPWLAANTPAKGTTVSTKGTTINTAKPAGSPKTVTANSGTKPQTAVSAGQIQFLTSSLAPYKEYYDAIDGRRSYNDWPRYQQITDLNGDGHNDLLICYTIAGYIDVFYNNGRGGFDSRSRTLLANNGKGLLAMAGHFNADKLMDIAYLSMADSSLHLLINEGKNTYTHLGYPNLKAKWLAVADYNADGKMDLVMPGTILLNKGNAVFTAFKTPSMYRSEKGFIFGTDVGPLRLSGMGDIDGNGTPDFAHPGIGKGLYDAIDIQLMPKETALKAGEENKPLETIKILTPGDITITAIGDFNGDGKADVVGSCVKRSELYFYLNKGANQFELTTVKIEGSIDDNTHMIVSDADGDGIEDLVVNVLGYPRVIGCTQKGGTVRAKVANWNDRENLEMNTGAMAIGDLTGDGIADQVAFAAHLAEVDADKKCGAEYCFALVTFKGRKDANSLTFVGRESPNSIENLAAEGARKTEENRRKQQTSKSGSSSGAGSSVTTKTTQPPTNLQKGITYYKGRSSMGLVIELEAEILYVPKEVKGVLGFGYQEIYQAICTRFRYPGTSNRWFSGGNTALYKCYQDSYSLGCIAIEGMVFEVVQVNRL